MHACVAERVTFRSRSSLVASPQPASAPPQFPLCPLKQQWNYYNGAIISMTPSMPRYPLSSLYKLPIRQHGARTGQEELAETAHRLDAFRRGLARAAPGELSASRTISRNARSAADTCLLLG
jgi:hypothetical protein